MSYTLEERIEYNKAILQYNEAMVVALLDIKDRIDNQQVKNRCDEQADRHRSFATRYRDKIQSLKAELAAPKSKPTKYKKPYRKPNNPVLTQEKVKELEDKKSELPPQVQDNIGRALEEINESGDLPDGVKVVHESEPLQLTPEARNEPTVTPQILDDILKKEGA